MWIKRIKILIKNINWKFVIRFLIIGYILSFLCLYITQKRYNENFLTYCKYLFSENIFFYPFIKTEINSLGYDLDIKYYDIQGE